MSLKWTSGHSDSGILRKSEFKEKKEELFVFGYSCKLFRDDDKALHVDQGKHLIPWMGDETLKIDRYDARGALNDLSTHEAPAGGYDWRVELTKGEQDVEQLCDEERYRALHTDEDEELMYKEEELKRLHAAGYGQVGFNYDTPAPPEPAVQPAEADEPFVPAPEFKALFSPDIVMPETQKLNAIIEKTAKFIASQGAQMEILIKAKQHDNPQFQFLNKDCGLYPYYTALIALVKAEKWPEKKPEVVEDKHNEHEEYLHPSLASTVIESAPSIPSIQYRPSADCDYTMLVCKLRGSPPREGAPGELAPPGTEPLEPRPHIHKPPVLYSQQPPMSAQTQAYQYATYPSQITPPVTIEPPVVPPTKSTGLSLMKNYNTDSDTDSDSDMSAECDKIVTPPEDVKIVIDKMASYVARNGDEFADIVRAKNDPRFTFLDPGDQYHPYYKRTMHQMSLMYHNGDKNKSPVPVSFSIKKLKEPDPILPRPALPYESSSEDDEDKEKEKERTERPETELPKSNILQVYPSTNLPPVIVYKIESSNVNIPAVKISDTTPKVNLAPKPPPPPAVQPEIKKVEQPPVPEKQKVEEVKIKSPSPRKERHKEKESHKKEKKRHHRKERSTADRDRRTERNGDKEKRRERDSEIEREKKRRKCNKDELENEIISLVDNSDDLIDLTGDQSDTKVEVESEADRARQAERRRRAAAFLRRAGVDPAAAALPATSLASAMVDTLESIRKKKEDDEKRRRREKRRHRDRYDYDDPERSHRKSRRRRYRSSDDEEVDQDGSKKKKRKKEKKHSTSRTKKSKRRDSEEEISLPLNLDLTNTLKELRTASPTKDLVLQNLEESGNAVRTEASSEEELQRDRKRKEREYSEGEWSSDSDDDSASSGSKMNE